MTVHLFCLVRLFKAVDYSKSGEDQVVNSIIKKLTIFRKLRQGAKNWILVLVGTVCSDLRFKKRQLEVR